MFVNSIMQLLTLAYAEGGWSGASPVAVPRSLAPRPHGLVASPAWFTLLSLDLFNFSSFVYRFNILSSLFLSLNPLPSFISSLPPSLPPSPHASFHPSLPPSTASLPFSYPPSLLPSANVLSRRRPSQHFPRHSSRITFLPNCSVRHHNDRPSPAAARSRSAVSCGSGSSP